MAYVIGIDGGGTKTEGILCDHAGNMLGRYTGGPSNHQFISADQVKSNVGVVIEKLITEAGLKFEDVSYVYLGLAGNDSADDCRFLTELLRPVMRDIPYCIENDLWAAMAAVPGISWGVIAVCGTGYNMGIMDQGRKRHTLRALEYEHGNISATRQLITDALHFAFQSDEHTGMKTELERTIPSCLGVKTMEEVLSVMKEEPEIIYKNEKIVRELFSLARSRDIVSQEILINMGRSIGRMLGNYITHIGLEKEEVPVILSGSIFVKAVSRLHIDAAILELRRYVPDFSIIINKNPAAAGACAEALRKIGKTTDAAFFKKIGEGQDVY